MAERDFTMEEVIDYLIPILKNKFSDQVSQVYFGDIGVYLPATFGSSRRDQKAILALSPESDHEMEGQRTAAYELRMETINIITMVNITPDFRANPEEAYGERRLVRLTTQIKNYLNSLEMENLGGRVQYTRVGDIDWAWTDRQGEAIRAARLLFHYRIRDNRME